MITDRLLIHFGLLGDDYDDAEKIENGPRGWTIYREREDGIWRFVFNDASTFDERNCHVPCIKCGLLPVDDHDACIANLPGVTAACCGHGIERVSYILFDNGIVIRGFRQIGRHGEEECSVSI